MEKSLWEKVVGGNLRLKSKKIKPGDKIRATEEELKGYLKQFRLVEGTISEPEPVEKVIKEKQPDNNQKFTVSHTGKGWYDVVSADGKVMNEGKLRAEEAGKLADQLNA